MKEFNSKINVTILGKGVFIFTYFFIVIVKSHSLGKSDYTGHAVFV